MASLAALVGLSRSAQAAVLEAQEAEGARGEQHCRTRRGRRDRHGGAQGSRADRPRRAGAADLDHERDRPAGAGAPRPRSCSRPRSPTATSSPSAPTPREWSPAGSWPGAPARSCGACSVAAALTCRAAGGVVKRDDVVSLLSALVAIDSVNPSLVPGGAGEAEIARFVADWARDAGLEVELLEATPGRPSVLVRARGSGGGRTLLLCGHLDTVGVEGMTDAARAARRRRPPLRARRLRHEGRASRPRCSPAARRRGSGWPATWSWPRSPTRSTRASASRRRCARVARRRRDRHRADRARARRRAQGLRLGGARGRAAAPRTARARTSASTRSSRPGRS